MRLFTRLIVEIEIAKLSAARLAIAVARNEPQWCFPIERDGSGRNRNGRTEQKLDLLAEVAVQVGLGLKAGQELVMTASLDSRPAGCGALPSTPIVPARRW